MKLPISVMILAKNEEKTIRFCVQPLKNHVQEILVCDTGSSDRTISIAKSLGAIVIKTKLAHDFAAVRNIMIEKASCPWLLKLDADSRIAARDVIIIGRLIQDPQADAFVFRQRNYSNLLQSMVAWYPCRGEYPAEEKFSKAYGYCDSEQIFLFKKLPGVRYRFPIHETPRPSLEEGKFRIKKADVVFHHFEYAKGMKHHFKKHFYYLYLQRKSAKRFPDSAPNRFNLVADTLLTGGDPKDIEKEALAICRKWPRQPAHHALLGIIYMLQNRHNKAREAIKKALYLRRLPEYLCLAGWCCLRQGSLAIARYYLNKSLQKNRDNPLALNLYGICSYLLGDNQTALRSLEKAIRLLPCYEDAHFNRTLVQRTLVLSKKITL